MSKKYSWIVKTHWNEPPVDVMTDSGQRGEVYLFDTQDEAEKFVMMYKLRHTMADEFNYDEDYLHTITITTPEEQAKIEAEAAKIYQKLRENHINKYVKQGENK